MSIRDMNYKIVTFNSQIIKIHQCSSFNKILKLKYEENKLHGTILMDESYNRANIDEF